MSEPALHLGIDVGATTIKTALVGKDGAVANKVVVDTPKEGGNEEFLAAFDRTFEQLGEALGGAEAIGIGAVGPLDLEAGTIIHSANVSGIRNCPLRAHVEHLSDKKVFFNNDGNVAALGQYHFGIAKGEPDFCIIGLGTGIAGGCLLGGELFNGYKGNAFEIGHAPGYHENADLPKRQCGCGSVGCLETYASATGVAGYYEIMTSESGVDARQVAERARAGDKSAQRCYQQAGLNLGLAITGLVHTLNLPLIIITGGMAAAHELFSPTIEKVLAERLFPVLRERTRVLYTEGDENSGILGAAALCF